MREKLRDLSAIILDEYYFEIMYFTLLILSASILSYFDPTKRFIYFIILGIHLFSLYYYSIIDEILVTTGINFILIVASICLHIFIPIVAGIILSLIISYVLGRFANDFVIEEGTVFLGEESTKEEKIFCILKRGSVRCTIKCMLFAILLFSFGASLFFNNFDILTNILFTVVYLVINFIIIYLCDKEGFFLEDCFYDYFEVYKHFFD